MSQATELIDPELSEKQNLWVYWYTHPETLFNGTESARRGKYGLPDQKDSTLWKAAHDNSRNPKVMAAVRKRLKEQYRSADVTIEKVLTDLESHRVAALAAGNYQAANQATAMHGKYLKMFVDRIEHVHTLEEASTDELTSLLNSLVGKVDGLNLDLTARRHEARASDKANSAGTTTTH